MDVFNPQRSGRGSGSVESASRMTAATPAPPPETDTEAGWKTESVSIRQAENGGFVVDCSEKRETPRKEGPGQTISGGSDYRTKSYAFSGPDEMLAHVGETFGVQGGAPADGDEMSAAVDPYAGEA